jgi:acyl-[acyl-carrier-protein]-phospholipid O-acyltransferase/long-chain-fatty-acid--[acyl-carrier-protein] ligase
LSGYSFLTALLIARRLLRKSVLKPDETNVGALVPMSVGGMVVNGAIAIDRRVVVNLNPTFGNDILNYCIERAGLSHVLTSRRLIQRFPDMKLNASVVCMEDLLAQATKVEKLLTLLYVIFMPSWFIDRQLGLHHVKQEDDITIIFTSGSTGRPKGVQLSYGNIGHCARGFLDMIQLQKKDVTLCVLPFFHAFGYVGNFWLVTLSCCTGILHYSPLDAKLIGELARKHKCTFAPLTPTFLRNYFRRCPREDFEKLNVVITGAEKLPLDLMEAWEQKYGIRPAEGYGTTELSPCAATNIVKILQLDPYHPYLRDGSIGQPLPHNAMKIVDLDTGDDLPPKEVGMIVVKGPIVMKGYYRAPEMTEKVVQNRWYTTGDVGYRDEEGFVFITGRLTRISKIGGEMVPHVLIEEKIQKIVEAAATNRDKGDGMIDVAVTALPHETRGEQIIVLHRKLSLTVAEIRTRMIEDDFPKLWIPNENCFREVERIPILGTGKLDLAAVKKLAVSEFGED